MFDVYDDNLSESSEIYESPFFKELLSDKIMRYYSFREKTKY